MYKGENFSREIIDLICDDWNDDKQLVIDALVYLYYTTDDDKMKSQIVDVCNDYGYCVECRTKLITYSWDEIHTELEYDNREPMSAQFCPICDKYEITSDMKEVE